MEEFQLNPFFLTPLLFLILFWSVRKLFLNSANKKKLPPSPRKLPIIGNLHQLSLLPHQDLHYLAKKHGPLMLLHFGSTPALIVSSADWAREIMKNHDITFASRPAFKVFKKLVYDCKDVAVAPYSENWRKMKSIMVMHLLSSKRVQSSRYITEEETALFVKKVRESSGALNLSDLFRKLIYDDICRKAMGKKYSESENGKKFLLVLSEFLKLMGNLEVGEFIPWLSWISRVNGVYKRMDRVAKEMDQVLENVIEEQMEAQRGQDFKAENEESFVDIMLQIYKHNNDDLSIDRDSIKPLILDVFVAGTDTTSTTLEWIMTELLRHPAAMEKLQHEVRGIMKKRPEITDDDIEKMHYLKVVIKETLRYHPPVPLLVPRVARKDVQINGYDVPAGTIVMINAWAIGRDPVYWDEPQKFMPERFLNSSIDFKGLDFEFTPFGSGRRGCPGMTSALATIELVLANIVQKFDWKLANGIEGNDLDMTESPGIAAHRAVPLLTIATISEECRTTLSMKMF